MRRKVLEGSVLFVSIVKWLFLATGVGILVGLSTTIFLKALEASIGVTTRSEYYFLFLPAALFLSTLLIRYGTLEAKGHGTEKVIEAVHKRSGAINPLVAPVKLVASIITIAFGGSAGKEGVCAQIGAGLSSSVSGLLRFDNKDRKKLVICGISAGFATVFGTPIAGAIFGVEVLLIGGILYDVLLPSFVAGIVGFQVASALGITYFHEPLTFMPSFTGLLFVKVCISGLFFGLCSLLFIEILRFFEKTATRIKIWDPYKGILGGVILIVLTFLFSSRYLGLGLDTIQTALEGGKVPAGSFALKILFSAVTLSFGGSGGIVTPIFFVGATAGNLFGTVLGFDPKIFAAIGMVSLLAGAANTPIAASIMAVELFGAEVAPYAAVACIISFLMTGHRSVYPSQVLAITKSSSILVAKGVEMAEIVEVNVELRPKSLSGKIVEAVKTVQAIFRRDKK